MKRAFAAKSKPKKRAGPSRLGRTLRSLATISALGVVLAIYNAYSLHRDTSLATGPVSPPQHEFFLDATTRPDIALFFKGLTHDQKMVMAARIGAYDDAKLAALLATLLGSFDADARGVLTKSLTHVGEAHPEAVAEQLKVAGSLQQFAISTALRTIGPPALPAVADMLKNGDARPRAVAFLVARGASSVPFLLPRLDDANKDIRLAAADALGKLGAREAVAPLVALYQKSTGDEREGYLTAISGIGAPETEGLLTAEASDRDSTTPRRAQAMLGLGRIASASAVASLWSLSGDVDTQIQDAVITGLQLAGPVALQTAPTPEIGLRVAAGNSNR